MRAIIIDDKDARALLDALQLQRLQADNILRANPDHPPTVDEIHGAFRYVVVRWLQDQGASVIQ